MLVQRPSVDRETARAAIEAALAAAERLGVAASITVVDAAGYAVALERMDAAPLHCIDLATHKASSAALSRLSGPQLWKAIARSRWLASGIGAVRSMNWLGGGEPIRWQGAVVGAVGVSSDHGMGEDVRIAREAVRAAIARLGGA